MKKYTNSNNDEFSSIKNIVEEIINDNKADLSNKFTYELIKNSWTTIIGSIVGETLPDRLTNGTLYVACNTQGLINTLHFYKKEIIKNINSLFKDDIKVTDIKFFFKSMNSQK